MSVTITLPKLDLPSEFPLLTLDNPPWDEDELSRLAERLCRGDDA